MFGKIKAVTVYTLYMDHNVTLGFIRVRERFHHPFLTTCTDINTSSHAMPSRSVPYPSVPVHMQKFTEAQAQAALRDFKAGVNPNRKRDAATAAANTATPAQPAESSGIQVMEITTSPPADTPKPRNKAKKCADSQFTCHCSQPL